MKKYKIAVLSDIHSNYVAAKAILSLPEVKSADRIICAGDIIGGFTQPNETVDLLREHNVMSIHGNREDYLRSYAEGHKPLWDKYHQMLPVTNADRHITPENKNYLFSLSETIVFHVQGTSVRVVHGSLRRVNELIYKYEDDKIIEALACAEEDILICGHSHQQWSREVDGTLIVNPGSAGLSFRKGGFAPYTMINFEDGHWDAEQKQVNYDVSEVQKAFDTSNILHYKPWENMLMHSIKDGKVATLAFLHFAKEYALKNGWDGAHGLIPNDFWEEANDKFDWDNVDFISRAKKPS